MVDNFAWSIILMTGSRETRREQLVLLAFQARPDRMTPNDV